MRANFNRFIHQQEYTNRARMSHPMSNTLWRLPDSGHIKDHQVVPEDMAFDTIIRIHCKHAHTGKNKTFDLREEYCGITRGEVSSCIL